jgi:hypothetical protein
MPVCVIKLLRYNAFAILSPSKGLHMTQECQECQVLFFPLSRCVDVVRTTAAEWIEMPTQEAADQCEYAMTQSIVSSLVKLGASPAAVGKLMGGFWHAVEIEAERLLNLSQSKG